jgi:glutamine synthetase
VALKTQSEEKAVADYYRAEYIWIDGGTPTAKLRSKTKVIAKGEKPPIWGFDGSSTNQAPGSNSDCVLKPVFICPDPIRGGDNKLVLNEVLLTDMSPHPSNTRAACSKVAKKYAAHDTWFGIEQEYTFFEGSTPLGWPSNGFPGPQGPYYCGVGADEVFGRDIVEAHTTACIAAGIKIAGTNGEVMPGQWEFQIGPAGTVEAADMLWMARWLLYRIAEDFGVNATLDPKPVKGDWNGAGAHTNFSTREMRAAYKPCVDAAEALKKKHDLHIANYGFGIEGRLTGLHETASYKDFSYGVSDRGASVRIPWQVALDKKGYIEDRRPNANMDPYVVTRLIVDTVCGAMASGGSRNGIAKAGVAKASKNGASKAKVPAKVAARSRR